MITVEVHDHRIEGPTRGGVLHLGVQTPLQRGGRGDRLEELARHLGLAAGDPVDRLPQLVRLAAHDRGQRGGRPGRLPNGALQPRGGSDALAAEVQVDGVPQALR